MVVACNQAVPVRTYVLSLTYARAGLASHELKQLARAGQCELLFFDEFGFSPNPSIQSGWSPVGQTRGVEPLSLGERVNVLLHCGMTTHCISE